MARHYSVDLHERVAAAAQAAGSVCVVAARFGVSASTAVQWSQRARATGGLAPLPVGGNKAHVLAGERDWLLRRIGETPDLTLRAS